MWAHWPGLGDLWQLAGLRFDIPATRFSTHIFRKLFKAFKEDLMHCQKGVSNAIICLLIHTLLFSLSPLPMEAGEAGRCWKEPHGQREGGVTPHRERRTSERVWWVQERAVSFLPATVRGLWRERQGREAGGDEAVTAALGAGGSGEFPAKLRWLWQCDQRALSKNPWKRLLSPG